MIVEFSIEIMAKVHINNVVVCENPSAFSSNFQFQITFECTEELNDGLFRIIFFHLSQNIPFTVSQIFKLMAVISYEFCRFRVENYLRWIG